MVNLGVSKAKGIFKKNRGVLLGQKRINFLFFHNALWNKNECEIHSKVIVSQDYFDYWVRV